MTTRKGGVELPVFSDDEQEGLKDFLVVYEEGRESLRAALMATITRLPDLAALMSRMPEEAQRAQEKQSHELLRGAILEGKWEPLVENQRLQGTAYAGVGVRFAEWFELVSDFQRLIVPELVKRFGGEPERLSRALVGMRRYVDMAMRVIGEAYLGTKEELITKQQLAIQEVSTPVLKLRDRMLLLPIIGVIDTARARHLTRQLLYAVRDVRAKVVVIDITGVPVVDSKVANHLIQTVQAARLMGARSVITGLSAEVAQALVVLGIDLRDLITIGDLQGGIEEAERLMSIGPHGSAGSRP